MQKIYCCYSIVSQIPVGYLYVYTSNREVVAIKEKEYGADHPSVAMELNNLAVSYCHLVRNVEL